MNYLFRPCDLFRNFSLPRKTTPRPSCPCWVLLLFLFLHPTEPVPAQASGAACGGHHAGRHRGGRQGRGWLWIREQRGGGRDRGGGVFGGRGGRSPSVSYSCHFSTYPSLAYLYERRCFFFYGAEIMMTSPGGRRLYDTRGPQKIG